VTGFVMEGLPFMSLRRLPAYETPNLNYTLLGFAFLVFLGVLLRRFFQRKLIAGMKAADRSAYAAAVLAAAANWITVIAGGIVLAVVADRMFSEVPGLFKAWLVLPILATLAGLYLLARTWGVWRRKLLSGTWARARYTVVTLSALFMCWFYWYWNILGFQYL
jgi:hypothetical protein